MKNTSRLLCVLLTAALLFFSLVPAFAEINVDTSAKTIYMGSSDNSSRKTDWIYISGIEKGTELTDVKSSKKSVVAIRGIEKGHWEYKYYDPDEEYDSYSAEIYVNILKPGTATVSFKVDGKAYKKKYTVLGYTNPVKTFQLTGMGNKNLKSKFAKNFSVSEKMTGNIKAGNLKVAGASGWNVKELYWCDRSDYSISRRYSFGSNGVATAQMPVPSMKKTGSYYVYASLINTKTGGTQSVYYYMDTASSNRRK